MLPGNIHQMRCVGTVVATHHKHDVQRIFQQFIQGILAILGSTANGVKHIKIIIVPVPLNNGILHHLLKRLRLRFQHGGLVGDANLLQIPVGIKSRGTASFKPFQECLAVSAAHDVVAQDTGILQIVNHQVFPPSPFPKSPGSRSAGFLMGSLTVDNGGNPHGGVILHSFPDLHHVSACRIHNLHALLLQRIHERSGNTERGNNHHIVRSNPVIGGIQLLPGKFSNAHFLQLPVHFRIVNNVPNQKNPPVRKHSACRICYINSTAHAVAEPELPGEKKFRMAQIVHIARRTDVGNQFTLVMLLDFLFHLLHYFGPSHIHSGFAG